MIKNLKYIGKSFNSMYLGSKITTLLVIRDDVWFFYSHKHKRVMKAGTLFSYFLNNN